MLVSWDGKGEPFYELLPQINVYIFNRISENFERGLYSVYPLPLREIR